MSRFGGTDRKRERPEDVTQRQYCSVWGRAAGNVREEP